MGRTARLARETDRGFFRENTVSKNAVAYTIQRFSGPSQYLLATGRAVNIPWSPLFLWARLWTRTHRRPWAIAAIWRREPAALPPVQHKRDIIRFQLETCRWWLARVYLHAVFGELYILWPYGKRFGRVGLSPYCPKHPCSEFWAIVRGLQRHHARAKAAEFLQRGRGKLGRQGVYKA